MTDTTHHTTAGNGETAPSDIYKMTVNLNVLDHLGINLYSNIAAVLTEAVANAWDADAETVDIKIKQDGEFLVEITDDGIGMSVKDMNDKYLCVGYQRRKDTPPGRKTAKDRVVMGRKGLGKLSLFSIADIIEVHSAKDGQSHGLRMIVKGIRESVRKNEPFYRPEPVPDDDVTILKGTKIILREIKRQRLSRGTTALRKRLARRFSVIGEEYGFTITLNDEPITIADRSDLPVVQFLWTFGKFKSDKSSTPNVMKQELLPQPDGDWKVNGWIGTAKRPGQLDSAETGNLNGIVVFARGRLFHENILDKVNDGRLYTKYLTGQIEADFLDVDDKPDIATSDRQRIQEDDPRYRQLISFLKLRLSQVGKNWSEWRGEYGIEEATKSSPALAEWFASLSERNRKSAETLIASLSALPLDDDNRKLVYRHGILAFERMQLRGLTEELASSIKSVDKLLPVLADFDSLEAALYRDIIKSRLDVIENLKSYINEDVEEKKLQKYLFDHLWLIDPAWERATGSEVIESRLKECGVITADLTKEEELCRVDIAYRTNAGKHIIVELKRAGRQMKLNQLQVQGQLYVDTLKKILLNYGNNSPDIEVVFVLGKPVIEESSNPDRLKNSLAAVSPGSRIVHYDSLVKGALDAYSEYLEKSKKFDLIEKIVDRI